MTDRSCPNCGNPVAPEASLCPKCGERLLNPSAPGPGGEPDLGSSSYSGAPPGFNPPPTMGQSAGFPPPVGYGPPVVPPGFDPRLGMDPRQVPPGFGPPPGMYPPANYGYPPVMMEAPKQKSTAGILAILVGSIGVHFFYLGQKTWGLVFLLATIFSCGMAALLTTPVSIVQGIMYLCASDEEFYQKYVVQKRLF